MAHQSSANIELTDRLVTIPLPQPSSPADSAPQQGLAAVSEPFGASPAVNQREPNRARAPWWWMPVAAALGFAICALTALIGLHPVAGLPWWPAAGVGFALAWRFGPLWTLPVAIGVGAWAWTASGNWPVIATAAATAVLGPVAALMALRRLNEWKPAEYRLEAAIRLLLAVILVSSPLNALIISAGLSGEAPMNQIHPAHVFIAGWLQNALGMLLIAPVIVACTRGDQVISGARGNQSDPWLDFGAVALTAAIVLISLLVSEIGRHTYAHSLVFFYLPVAAWASIRCSEKTMAFTLLACATMILAGRALQLNPQDIQGPALIEASLLIFVVTLVAILLQAVAADRRLALKRVAMQARQDMTTGLLNDRGLLAVFGEQLANHQRPECGLLGLHISNFETLTDLAGSVATHELEQSVARLLNSQPGKQAAARLSAARYALVVQSDSLSDTRAVGRGIYSALNGQVFRTNNGSIRLQVCVGGLHIDQNTEITGEDCLASLFDAQSIAASVRDPQLFVEPLSQSTINARRAHQSKIEQIRESIREHRFEVHAQPILDEKTPPGKLSYEILIRLKDTHGGLVQPPEFMSLAVQAQMTPAMDRGVIARVFSWLAENPAALARTHKCSINLSGLTMSDGMIAAFIREERARYSIPPECIVFEITESEAIKNPAAASRLVDELKSEGFGIALDDFGVGLATFEYLKRFPIDYLKIDGSFVRNLIDSPIDEEIVMATVRVARRLNVQTVAEHVQSQAIYQRLQTMGVQHFQGEHLGTVVPLAQLFDTTEPSAKDSQQPGALSRH